MSRAARYTIERKKREHYSDFLTNFDKNPVTGYLGKAVDRQAIEQSMRNIILTDRGDWPFESTLGSTVRASLFDLNDDRSRFNLESSIREAIRFHEPRVSIESVIVSQPYNSLNDVYISLVYSILNIPDEVFQFEFSVNRVR